MVESSDCEHANEVEQHGGDHRERTPTDHEDEQAGQVEDDVGDGAAEIEAIALLGSAAAVGLVVGVPPLAEHDGKHFQAGSHLGSGGGEPGEGHLNRSNFMPIRMHKLILGSVILTRSGEAELPAGSGASGQAFPSF